MPPLSLFGFVEMTEEGAKAKPFYTVMTNSGCRVRTRFLTLSQLLLKAVFLICSIGKYDKVFCYSIKLYRMGNLLRM